MSRNYAYTVENQPDGKYLIKLVDFPTGVTEADSVEDVEVFAREILEGLIEAYTEDNIPLPDPSPVGNRPFITV